MGKSIIILGLIGAMAFMGCSTTSVADNKYIQTASENVIRLEKPISELSRNFELENTLNQIQRKNLVEMSNLVDEAEIAFNYEKEIERGKGFEEGKKAAIKEIQERGYVVLSIEELRKLGLWD